MALQKLFLLAGHQEEKRGSFYRGFFKRDLLLGPIEYEFTVHFPIDKIFTLQPRPSIEFSN